MKKTRKSNSKNPSFEPDVIEKDLCKLFPKEWLRTAAKETGLNQTLKTYPCGR